MKTQGKNKDVVFLSGVRTGYGDFGGTLKNLSATQLGTIASKHGSLRGRWPASSQSTWASDLRPPRGGC